MLGAILTVYMHTIDVKYMYDATNRNEMIYIHVKVFQ